MFSFQKLTGSIQLLRQIMGSVTVTDDCFGDLYTFAEVYANCLSGAHEQIGEM